MASNLKIKVKERKVQEDDTVDFIMKSTGSTVLLQTIGEICELALDAVKDDVHSSGKDVSDVVEQEVQMALKEYVKPLEQIITRIAKQYVYGKIGA